MAITFIAKSATATGTGDSLEVSAPSGISEGDLLIGFISYSTTSSSPAPVSPTNWSNSVQQFNDAENRVQRVDWKRATASEPSSYTWTGLSSPLQRGQIGVILLYRGTILGSDPINVKSSNDTASGTSHATPGIVTTEDNQLLIALVSSAGPSVGSPPLTWTPPGGMTERTDDYTAVSGNPLGSSLADVIQTSAGSSGTKTFTSNNSVTAVATLLAVLQAPDPTPITGSGFTEFSESSTIGGTAPALIQFAPKFGSYALDATNDICVENVKVELDVRLDAISISRRDGALVRENPAIGSRRILMRGSVSGDTLEAVRQKIHEICGKLKRQTVTATSDVVGPNETGLPVARHRLFIYNDKFIMCYNKEFTWKILEGSSGYEALWETIFIADDPFFYSDTVNSVSGGPTTTAPLTLSSTQTDYGIPNRDDDPSGIFYPVIKITSAQNFSKIRMTYPATGLGGLMFNFFVQVGDGVSTMGSDTWTFKLGDLQILKDTGNVDQIDKLTVDSKFWGLEQPIGVGKSPNPGLVTIDWLPGGTSMNATIHWRPRFM